MVVRKMRTKKEIKAQLSKYISDCVIIEKELESYETECEKNGLIPEYEITNQYKSQIDVLSLKIFTLQWVLNE
jgi:hypothetical protein